MATNRQLDAPVPRLFLARRSDHFFGGGFGGGGGGV